MKQSEIQSEARKVIKDIFYKIKKSDNKEDWKKAIEFVHCKISSIEFAIKRNIELGEDDKASYNLIESYIWKSVRNQLTNLFKKKFIIKTY